MRSNKRLQSMAVLAVLLAGAMLLSGADHEKQLTVYTPQTSYSVEARDHEGQLYINLMDLVGPFGGASLRMDGHDWKLQLNGVEARFTEGKDKAKVRGNTIDLGGKAVVENDHLLVPLKSSFAILSPLLKKNVEFRPEARRIFIDNAATRFTAELKKSDKSSLVLNFNQPVHPVATQDENAVKLVFKREPVISDIVNQPFDDKVIHALNFSEENGAAALTIAGGPGLNVAVSNDGRSITIQSAPVAVAATTPPQPPAQQPPTTPASPSPETQQSTTGNQVHAPTGFFVLIDASHGGSDQGALLTDKLPEKEVTLTFARRLKAELEDRGIAVRLLREADTSLGLEQRAETANAQHPGIYLALHAGMPGQGVRIYVPAVPSVSAGAGKFLPWESAQSAWVDRSQTVAQAVGTEIGKKEIRVVNLSAPLRPLNNVAAPAIAVELAPDPNNIQDVASQKFLTSVAAGVAAGVAQVRTQLEAQR